MQIDAFADAVLKVGKSTVLGEGYIKRNCSFKEKYLQHETSDGLLRVSV